MGGGSLREQVDEKYKVNDGTKYEGATTRGGGHERSVRSIYRLGETLFPYLYAYFL
jgi:hypothetical protein